MAARILGLDSLRFLAALCVVQGHLRVGGFLFVDDLKKPRPFAHWAQVAFNQGFPLPTGPNAVVVFFVISGFCIHFPYRNETRIDFREFIVRRYVRVGLPALVAAYMLYNTGFHSLQDSVLWSIICEMIYYTLYPVFLAIKRKYGWYSLLAVAFLAAFALDATRRTGPYNGDFTSFGAGLTWILGLPCWLLGCILAEKYTWFRPQRTSVQWAIRWGFIIAAATGTTLRFYDEIGYFWSQPILAIIVYFWIGSEIAYFSVRRPWQWLESCGKWSYSIYLYHAPLAIYLSHKIAVDQNMRVKVLMECVYVLVGSYVLYRLVERPSHLLARRYQSPRHRLRLAREAA
jgi:peptidoglycan/LPS O-acetylase OafA/YrhL